MADSLLQSRGRALPWDEPLFRSFSDLGLQLRIEFDIAGWIEFIKTTEWPVVNASISPEFHAFRPGEVFWVNLVDGGKTVATQVFRLIETDDYVDLVRSHRLWYGDHPSRLQGFSMLAEDAPRMGGLVVQLSGLYIQPDWRRARVGGQRLVAAFVRLMHSFTWRNYAPDWSVSLLEERVSTPRMMHDLYGYPHATPLFQTWMPELARSERVTLIWMAGPEIAAQVESRPRPADSPGRSLQRRAG
jgi:GNAT superfamily N-acetyltransferase